MEQEKMDIKAGELDSEKRLDKFIADSIDGKSRSFLQKLFSENRILKGGKPLSKSYRVKPGDEISVILPPVRESSAKPQNIPLDVVYEDDYLLVVNKPKGMVVHPAAGNYDGTLVNALLYHCGDSLSGIGGVIRPGIVHRIDKDTSGLLIVAKNDYSHVFLAQQIKEHSFSRQYEAVVYGRVKQDSGVVDAPIGRSEKDRKKMCVTEKNSKNAVTEYEVVNRYERFTHVRLTLKTGRTHQIRVHMAYLGHPVAGDAVYGPKKVITKLSGQCLHAKTIGFIHPKTKQYMQFDSNLPDYFLSFINSLR